MKAFNASFLICAVLLAASSAFAFPTKVKLLKAPDLLSSEGTEVVVTTNKGTVTTSYRHPAYQALSRAKKGQCLTLETDSESTVDFGKKLDASGVSTVTNARC